MNFSSAWEWLKKHPFWLGFIGGPSWVMFLGYLGDSLGARPGSFFEKVVSYFLYPAYPFGFFFNLFDYLCPLLPPDSCRGLGLDGGPLEWLEWVMLFLQFAIGYGILFWAVSKGWALGEKYLMKKTK
jgi:hypothetical protein